ncbi:MAG TPA: ABC transporter permease subunit [Thermoplasmata archaeon]|nr:ABC transporter permease subunit [Thermoplasmata archaeon]
MAQGLLSRRPMPPPIPGSASIHHGPSVPTHTRAHLEEALQAVRETPSLLAGIALLAFFAGVSVAAVVEFGPHLTAYYVDRLLQRVGDTPPSAAHPMGAINLLGVDVFQGIFQATPLDLSLIGSILLGSAGLGLLAGTSGGLFGGRSEWIVSATADLTGSVPPVFLVSVLFIGIAGFLPYSYLLPAFVVLFVLVLWPYYARPVLARARQVADTGYIQAAQVSGARRSRLLLRHGMPNSYLPILAQLPADFANIIFVLTMFPYLSCLTNGETLLVSPLPNQSYPDWGFMLAYGICSGWSPFPGGNFWWMYAFPAGAIVLFGTAIALCCDGLERWSARRLRR